MARRKRSRKHAGRKSRSRRKKVAVIAMNPGRRRRSSAKRSTRRRSRRYHRNPGLSSFIPSTGFVKDAVFIVGGAIGTKMAANFVLPMVGINQPIARIAIKGVLAGAIGYVGKMVLGQAVGQQLMIGGLVETVNDAVQTYVVPMVPALAVSGYEDSSDAYGIGAYPSLSAYPELSGMVTDDVMETV